MSRLSVPAAPPRTRSGSTCVTFPQRMFRVRPRPAAPRGGGRMVLVATRCDAGKAQALGLTNSKRWGLPMPVAKIHLLEGQYSEARLFAMFDG